VKTLPHHENNPHPENKETATVLIMLGTDTFTPDVNGAARFTERLATGLARRGHEVHVVAPAHPDAPAPDGMWLHPIASRRYPGYPAFRIATPWRVRAQTREVLAGVRPDVVHVQSHFLIGRALTAWAGAYGVPLVATSHLMPENVFDHLPIPALLRRPATQWLWGDVGRILGQAQVVTTPTPTAVGLLSAATGLQGVRSVSCGIDTDPVDRAGRRFVRDPRQPPTVLFVGRLDAEKRIDELLRAFAALPARLDDARLQIVGKGPRAAALRALAGELGIAARVDFAGFVSDAELVQAYLRCAAFCMPSVAELQSIATLEAMAAARPVIAADAMALPHLVRPGENGHLFRPGDIAGLSRALADVLTAARERPAVAARMGARSRELVEAHTMTATLDAFEDVYAAAGARDRAPALV